MGVLQSLSPCLSWPCTSSYSSLCREPPIWAPDLPWGLFWAPCLVSPSYLHTSGSFQLGWLPFPLLLEHLVRTPGGSPSPAQVSWPLGWRVGWVGGRTALPPNHLSALLPVCPGPGRARVCPCPAFGPGLPSWGRVLRTLPTLSAGLSLHHAAAWGALTRVVLSGWARRGVGCLASCHPVTSQWHSLPLCPAPDGSSAAAGTGHHVPGLRGLHLLRAR